MDINPLYILALFVATVFTWVLLVRVNKKRNRNSRNNDYNYNAINEVYNIHKANNLLVRMAAIRNEIDNNEFYPSARQKGGGCFTKGEISTFKHQINEEFEQLKSKYEKGEIPFADMDLELINLQKRLNVLNVQLRPAAIAANQ